MNILRFLFKKNKISGAGGDYFIMLLVGLTDKHGEGQGLEKWRKLFEEYKTYGDDYL